MNKKSINKLIAGAFVFESMLSLNAVDVHAEIRKGWVLENSNWYYYDNNGEEVKDTTITIEGKQYKFDRHGVWIPSEENKADIEKAKKEIDAEAKAYAEKYKNTQECSEDYKKRDDRWCNKGGNWYFDELGTYKDELKTIDSWEEINGYWYYFDDSGVMQRNVTIKDENGNDCILNSDGVLTNRERPEFKAQGENIKDGIKYSWKKEDGNTYYVSEYGEKVTGWISYDGNWYYMNGQGIMQKNKNIIKDGKKYALGADGAMIS